MSTSHIKAILISVGGTNKPILHILRKNRPAHVWYFCSDKSRPMADAIQDQLEWRPAPRFIEVKQFEELGPCYCELRKKIPDILCETKINPDHVLVDYTGGTKTMSAALVLAAVELFHNFSYVGGEQRNTDGLGTVKSGTEKPIRQPNPWTELAVREVERAGDLWKACQFEAAAQVLREVAPRVERRGAFEALAELAEAMAARHRLDFTAAKNLLGRLRGKLALLWDGKNIQDLADFVEKSQLICEACAGNNADKSFLDELLDNALRTAAQSRFEDAAARLYRAMEMQGQIWLAEVTNRLFVNGRCTRERSDSIPEPVKNLPFCRPDESGSIKFSMEQVFIALAALGHPRAKAIVDDIKLERKSKWRIATEQRNASILAHGVKPIGADGFEKMKQIASDFLGFSLEHEKNPIPPLVPRWFD